MRYSKIIAYCLFDLRYGLQAIGLPYFKICYVLSCLLHLISASSFRPPKMVFVIFNINAYSFYNLIIKVLKYIYLKLFASFTFCDSLWLKNDTLITMYKIGN